MVLRAWGVWNTEESSVVIPRDHSLLLPVPN